jgi:Fic family protein
VNGHPDSSALERAAYAQWRFNWIHPFAGGNGRASRALTYLIVCMNEERMLPKRSNSNVKRDRGSAHGTRTCRTPCSSQRIRGTLACR